MKLKYKNYIVNKIIIILNKKKYITVKFTLMKIFYQFH